MLRVVGSLVAFEANDWEMPDQRTGEIRTGTSYTATVVDGLDAHKVKIPEHMLKAGELPGVEIGDHVNVGVFLDLRENLGSVLTPFRQTLKALSIEPVVPVEKPARRPAAVKN
jgi:hypothetical protein